MAAMVMMITLTTATKAAPSNFILIIWINLVILISLLILLRFKHRKYWDFQEIGYVIADTHHEFEVIIHREHRHSVYHVPWREQVLQEKAVNLIKTMVLRYAEMKRITDGEYCLNSILPVEHTKMYETFLAMVKDRPMEMPTMYSGRKPPTKQMTAIVIIKRTAWTRSLRALFTSFVNYYPHWNMIEYIWTELFYSYRRRRWGWLLLLFGLQGRFSRIWSQELWRWIDQKSRIKMLKPR